MGTGDYGHPFIQAAKYTRGRSGSILWIVLHATDDHEHPNYAENLGRYFHNGSGGRNVSSHFGTDSNSTVQYVRLRDTAWCAMRTANRHGIHIEMSGLSRQNRAQWLDQFGMGLIEQTAQLIVRIAKDKGIPLKLLSDAELRARRKGIITHAQVTKVIGEGNTHTDPGRGFPFDVLMNRVREIAGETGTPPAPPSTPSYPRWPGRNLRYVAGRRMMSGGDVRTWQGQMADRGWTIAVDGVYGPQSAGVARKFQAEKGLVVDGVVGPVTWAASWTEPVTPDYPDWPGRNLRYRKGQRMMTGGDVRTWQARMRDRGWRIKVDGIYGPESAGVATKFQREKGLKVDGIVGPQTWKASWTAPIT